MKYIKLFLASSVVEFEQEQNELGSYIRMLNDIYAKRGIYFELTIWDDLPDAVARDRKQEECNQEIRDSQYFYVLFGKDAEEDTIQEFNVALEQFRKSGAPRIYTYFRQLPEGQSASQSVKDFMERLDQEIGHYYSTFSHLDAVKLNMLLELTRNSDINSNLKFEDGEAKLDGKPVLDLKNVPIYSKNEELQKQVAEKQRLDEEFADLRVAMIKAPENEELFSRLMEVSKQRNQLSDQIHQMERDILNLCSKVSKMNASGYLLDWWEKKAIQLLDAGKTGQGYIVVHQAEGKAVCGPQPADPKAQIPVFHLQQPTDLRAAGRTGRRGRSFPAASRETLSSIYSRHSIPLRFPTCRQDRDSRSHLRMTGC